MQTPVLELPYSRREYFISKIRYGVCVIKINGLTLKVFEPTIEEACELNDIYWEAYDNCLSEGIKTQDEMMEWMVEKFLWSSEDDEKLVKLEQDMERFRVEIFNAGFNLKLKQTMRAYLRAAEKATQDLNSKKNMYYSNTCEGIASSEKTLAFIKKCTYLNGANFDFSAVSINTVLSSYYSSVYSQSLLRYLARNDPWVSIWRNKEFGAGVLFNNHDREFSVNQNNLLVWSKIYDNVHESIDAPSEEVINDDDALDGWFIVQKRKRDKEKIDADIKSKTKNSKISNAGEVFLMSKSSEETKRINDLNDINAKVAKKQREQVIEQKGEVSQTEFHDEKLKIGNMARTQFKNKFGG
jgi:hypothetical protein